MSEPRKKRSADIQITHDNWDTELEKEEAGVFNKAAEDRIKGRKIITGRRRIGGSKTSASEGASASLFSGFGGFGNTGSAPAAPKSSFGLGSLAKPSVPAAGAGDDQDAFKKAAAAFVATQGLPPRAPFQSPLTELPPTASNGNTMSTNETFLRELKVLNVKFVRQLGSWVTENAHVDLSPAFADYAAYLADLEERHGGETTAPDAKRAKSDALAVPKVAFPAPEKEKAADRPAISFPKASDSPFGASSTSALGFPKTTAASTLSFPKVSSPLAGFSFGAPSASPDKKAPSLYPELPKVDASDKGPSASGGGGGFSFGIPAGGAAAPATSGGFSFGAPKDAPKTGFSFGAAVPGGSPAALSGGGLGGFSFGAAKPAVSDASVGEEEAEYTPPEPEKKEVEEADAFHRVRAKLFHQKEGKYVDGAVGNLFLKPLEGAKVQLLIRADNNLGTILLNAAVTKETPLSVTKNNLSVFTVPNPLPPGPKDESSSKKEARAKVPTGMLIRVKTPDDAEALLKEIKDRF